MAVTGGEGQVIQRFKKSAIDATTITLVPTTGAWAEAKPSHLAATQVVFTYTGTPENLFGTIAGSAALDEDSEYEISIKRVT